MNTPTDPRPTGRHRRSSRRKSREVAQPSGQRRPLTAADLARLSDGEAEAFARFVRRPSDGPSDLGWPETVALARLARRVDQQLAFLGRDFARLARSVEEMEARIGGLEVETAEREEAA